MICCLVNPLAGYRTFSRFDSLSCFPWTSIIESIAPPLPQAWCLKPRPTQNTLLSRSSRLIHPVSTFDNHPARHVISNFCPSCSSKHVRPTFRRSDETPHTQAPCSHSTFDCARRCPGCCVL